MFFASPLFWLAAAAVAVPIILHLTQKAAKRSVPFASLMFIRRVPRVEVRRRRIRNPLLLALRVLGILLLVAAFARPVVQGDWFSQVPVTGGTSTVLLLDASLSMSREEVWESAQSLAVARIGRMQAGDEIFVARFDESVEPLSGWEQDSSRLDAVIRQFSEPGSGRTDYAAALRFAAERFESATKPNREVHLISDLQEAGVDLDELSKVRLPAGVSLKVEDAGRPSINHFLEVFQLPRTVYGTQSPQAVTARVGTSASGASGSDATEAGESTSIDVLLYVEDTLVDRRQALIGPNGTGSVEIPPFKLPEGITRGRLVLDSKDEIPADDVVYFVVERTDPMPAMLVSPKGDGAAFLESALTSGKNVPLAVERRNSLGPVDPARFPLLILDDVPKPTAGHLERFLAQGGGLIVCLGDEVDLDWYANELSTVLPAKPVEKVYATSSGKPFVNVSDLFDSHPLLRPVGLSGGGIRSVPFYAYWKLEPKEGAASLAWMNPSEPLIVEGSSGGGRVLLFGSSLGATWSGFPTHGSFLPFWQEAALHVAGITSPSSSTTVGEAIASAELLGLGEDMESVRGGDLLSPAGKRLVGLGDALPERVVLTETGFYEGRAGGTTNWVAVNADRRESNLDRMDPEALEAALGASIEGRALAAVERRDQGMWWVLLVLALIVLLLESLLAARIAGSGGTGKTILVEGGR